MDVAGAEVGGESRCNGAPMVWFSQEEQLLRRLEEVERFGAKIAGELLKKMPCEGVVSRELLELELGELKRDRDTLEDKLTVLLSSATLGAAPNDGAYETSAGNTPRGIILRPSPPTRAERKHEENLTPRPITIDDSGVSVTKAIVNLSCDRKRFPADSEALGESSGGSKSCIAQHRPSAAPDGPDNNTSTSTISPSTNHGNGAITAQCGGGRDSDARNFDNLSSPVLVRSGSSTTYGTGAITAGCGGGNDLDAKTNDNHILSVGNGFEQATTGRPIDDGYARTDDSYARTVDSYARTNGNYARPVDSYARTDDSYARRARTVEVIDRNRRLYNATPAPPSRFGTAPSRAGYNGDVSAGGNGSGGGGGGVGRGVSGVSRPVAMVENVGGGGGGGRGFRVSKWRVSKSSDASARQTARSDTSRQKQRWASAPFEPETGTITARGGNPGIFDAAVVNISTTATRLPLKRPDILGKKGFHEPDRFSSGVRTATDSSEGGVTRASHVRSASRASSWQGERYDDHVGQRVKKGPFRAPVAPFGNPDLSADFFNEDRYLASPVSYPPPRPSHHSGYGEQRDYHDTQSVRRDMGHEEPFSKRKSFRVREKEGQEEEPCSKRRWPDAPARWSGVANGNGARGSAHEFAIHTVPVALAADTPCERVDEDDRLYCAYSGQGQEVEGQRPQGEMYRISFSSNTTQMLPERSEGRHELGPTVTPPPFR